MNEIELFLSLLDESGTNRLLKIFNDTSKKGKLEFKKIKLRRILKNQTQQTRNNSKDPFFFALNTFKSRTFKNFSEKEFFQFMAKRDKDLLEYEAFANFLIYFPEKTMEILPVLTENYRKGLPLF